jgi:shikimate kinase
MGTGKTVVGRRLAKRLGWRFVDVDELIESAAKKSIPKIFVEHGEAVFRRLEKRAVLKAVKIDQAVIATGGGAFVDPENRRLLKSAGPVVCLTANEREILQRIRATLPSRPLLAGEPSLARIHTLLAQRASGYAKADLTIDTTGLSVEQIAERIWEEIGPWVSRSWEYLRKHSRQLGQRYGGKYVAVMNDRIVASGDTQLDTYQRVRQPVPTECELGIYYIPLPEESALALSCPA